MAACVMISHLLDGTSKLNLDWVLRLDVNHHIMSYMNQANNMTVMIDSGNRFVSGSSRETVAVLLPGFAINWYQLIAKPGNKTATVPWPDPYAEYVVPTGLILGLWPANERWHYFVTMSLIGWAQTKDQPCSYPEYELFDSFSIFIELRYLQIASTTMPISLP